MKYTPAQSTAIAWPDENLLLSAAAGSGKTATLTERILYLLSEDRARLGEMLIVTYTRAAAAELRGRIGKKIAQAAKDSGSRRMARHLTELPGAQISTIHAFLYKTLRPHFASLGLSPDFSIGDEAVMNSLRQEAMRDTVDDFYLTGDMDFVALADTLAGSRDAEALDKTLLTIHKQITSAGETPDGLRRYGDTLRQGDFFTMPQSEPIRTRLAVAFAHYRQTLFHLRTGFSSVAEEKYGPAAEGMADWLTTADNTLSQGSYSRMRELLTNYTPVKLGRLSSKDADETTEAFKELREGLKKDIGRFQDSFFADDEETVHTSLTRTADLLATCSRVLNSYAKSYSRRKMSRSLLDYEDLEAMATALFLTPDGQPTETAMETGRQYKYIFIDEYQDTNRVQDAIFRALSATSPRFMVGDSKQSIYRFRGAEPTVFNGYREIWSSVKPGERETEQTTFSATEGHCLFMSENFRCDKTVVDFVNLVSDYLFPASSMPYTGEDALVFGKGTGEEVPAEIVLIEKSNGDGEEDEKGERTDNEEDPEASYVAAKISDLLRDGVVKDGDGERPMTPDDIAILLRSPDTSGESFRQALLRRGIPVRLPGGEYLFGSPAILLVMCLFHLADNPLPDIPTAGAMHSPLFGFATHELVQLRDWSRKQLSAQYDWQGDMPLYYVAKMAAEPDWSFLPEPAVEEGEVPEVVELDENGQNPGLEEDIETYEAFTDLSWAETEEILPVETAPAIETTPEETAPLPPELCAKCRYFCTEAEKLRDMAHGMRADRFLDELYRRFGFYELPEVRENPAERTNLQALYDLARRYESGSFGGVGGFLTYTEELRGQKQSGDGNSLPAVTILSIHKSKGLEYPVVFVSACSKKRNARDEMGDILFDADLGIGMRLPDSGGYARCGTALRSAIAEKKRLASVEEEMRVVYVALTRARNRLFVTGKVKEADPFLEKCRALADCPTTYGITGNRTYLEWILTAAMVHGRDHCWQLTTITDGTILSGAETASDTTEETVVDWGSKLAGNLDFTYDKSYLSAIPSKLTVSRLHPTILDEEDEGEKLTIERAVANKKVPATEETETDEVDETESTMVLPKFMQAEPGQMSAAERGTATHVFLQFANFDTLQKNGVKAELARLVTEHFMEEKTAAAVYLPQLERFRESDLFQRMVQSPLCHREFRFNAPMEAWRFTENPALAEKLKEDGIMLTVQGVVDCVFRDTDGKLTLVDYKTDRPKGEEWRNPALAAARLAERHGKQLGYYREICERMFGEPMGKTVIYSTALGLEIPVDV